uniref:Uncharacterized protein n=1 Tax=mine drainage metagenome TaxID=410659 RepID=E6QHE6_9ZZZZ
MKGCSESTLRLLERDLVADVKRSRKRCIDAISGPEFGNRELRHFPRMGPQRSVRNIDLPGIALEKRIPMGREAAAAARPVCAGQLRGVERRIKAGLHDNHQFPVHALECGMINLAHPRIQAGQNPLARHGFRKRVERSHADNRNLQPQSQPLRDSAGYPESREGTRARTECDAVQFALRDPPLIEDVRYHGKDQFRMALSRQHFALDEPPPHGKGEGAVFVGCVESEYVQSLAPVKAVL